MKHSIFLFIYSLFLLIAQWSFSQQIKFDRVLQNNNGSNDRLLSFAQDKRGFIWFTTEQNGLNQYDGFTIKSYKNDPGNANSLASNYGECLVIDASNIIWVGTYGAGLDRFDPLTNTFIHYRHNARDDASLSNDTVNAILEDHLGNLWIGSFGGLDWLNKKTGKFIHYSSKPNDPSSLSYRNVRVVYEDRKGTIWVGCGSPFPGDDVNSEDGGLNRLDQATGKFTCYLHDAHNPSSLENNKVRAIFEDSKGNFWIGTAGDGLHIMDIAKGTFTHYHYDPAHPEKLSRPRLFPGDPTDHITFITEDTTGAIWIGSLYEGINRYDPSTQAVTHYGTLIEDGLHVKYGDTLTGFNEYGGWRASSSKDGLVWICTFTNNLYAVNTRKTVIPYYEVKRGAYSFYGDGDSVLWIGTDSGLLRKDRKSGAEKRFLYQPGNPKSISSNVLNLIRADGQGNLWIATDSGIVKFDKRTNFFSRYKNDPGNNNSLSNDRVWGGIYIDHDKNLWVGTMGGGLNEMNKNEEFTRYGHTADTNSLGSDIITSVDEDQSHHLWLGTAQGLSMFDKLGKKFYRYLSGLYIKTVYVDSSGTIWAGSNDGLYYFDHGKNLFLLYTDPNSKETITRIFHILEDDKRNLWISTRNAIVEINEKRDTVKSYSDNYGVHINKSFWLNNLMYRDGELFIGDRTGYYAFFPRKLKDNSRPPHINLTSFKLSEQEVVPGAGSALQVPIWMTDEINLNYSQNVFSFEFAAIHYNNPGEEKYIYMLENYDNNWRNIGTDHKAYFFNVPPGNYIFKVKAFNSDGTWGEKDIRITITPPWWRTWWAYLIFAVLFICAVSGFMYYRSRRLRRENRVLEGKVAHRTAQLNQSLEHLKSTQAQLIQSEKMASLGELTAGIAHEIQNPLNFVNNFSEVNAELIEELYEERKKENRDFKNEDDILNDIRENEQKINHHGKRADAIVKGMLQHSRPSTGQKESTDINALADEYVRLSYQGFRARDKSFNVALQKDLDENIGKINIIPQDIGRVLLNLFNNAFYSVNEKKKKGNDRYEPAVSVSTKRVNDKPGSYRIEIRVKDNGDGIPEKAVDKIFQPFFTAKPTGQGTGLGLSLSYDIIKAHGGEIKVDNKENEGAEFTIILLNS